MITAVDTNILLDILVPNEGFYDASADALQQAAANGSLVIGDIVYAVCKASASVVRFDFIHIASERDIHIFESPHVSAGLLRNADKA
jgi:hypothetical protein